MRLEPAEPTDEQFADLGRIAVSFSRLELDMAIYIWGFVDSASQAPGRAITAGARYRQLLEMADALGKVKIDSVRVLAAHHEWIKGAKRLGERRNRIFHSYWIVEAHDPEVVRRSQLSRKEGWTRWTSEPLEDADLPQPITEIDSQRLMLRTIKEQLPDIFPERERW